MDAPLFPEKILACLKVPGQSDSAGLKRIDGSFRSLTTDHVFEDIHEVPSLFVTAEGEKEDVTSRVKSFYEENPFPNYEGLEEFSELVNKGYRNPFTTRLLESVGYNKLILECGCGTGQLSQFLQLNNNHTLGADITLASLSLAVEHKRRNGLRRSSFCQMDLFDLALKDASSTS